MLVASTSEVYGLSNDVPFREDGNLVMGATTKGRWSYACSKAIDEFLALAYWRERGLPTTIVRLFNTVGPRQTGQYGMVIPTFVKQALAGEPLTVFGDGNQSRCFTYVGDVVGALIKLMDLPNTIGEVFNIGSDQEVSILELARRVKTLTNSRSEIVTVSYEKAYGEGFEDMPRRVPDLSKIGSFIGYRPTKTLDQILESVIAFYREAVAGCIPGKGGQDLTRLGLVKLSPREEPSTCPSLSSQVPPVWSVRKLRTSRAWDSRLSVSTTTCGLIFSVPRHRRFGT